MPHTTLHADAPFKGHLQHIAEGEWADWYTWGSIDPFEALAGPFYLRRDSEKGGIQCGFRPAEQNRNGHGMIHGGSLMTFADFCLFAIASSAGEEIHGVTVTMNSEFVGPAQAGQLLLGHGEVVRSGGSLVFVRGTITADGNPVLAFSGTIKRIRPRA
ncbi:PaaI family thioesterase [Novosphingobium cyanobacteriorum]|uniref:PaaI family thioesterase n=1 Tax=Novosphingobium cyanobacteriorum TaxID=3024215 RepID=A0ABT6CP88_9SPHN|nr:PaaI family thioesterase [Novosphingobium cyanobacteriorum]MDF8335043.1 PaaI family thioesterase [Novosphingobium cyanobacteriorum]